MAYPKTIWNKKIKIPYFTLHDFLLVYGGVAFVIKLRTTGSCFIFEPLSTEFQIY